MADETDLEKTAKTAPLNESVGENQKPVGTLESVVNETLDLGKTTLNLSAAGAIPAAQAILLPTFARDTAILAGAQIAGDATTDFRRGKKFTSTGTLESAVVGTGITIPTYYMFDLINKIPTENLLGYGIKGAAWGGLAYPAFFGIYQFMDYVVKNKTFSGVGGYLKENYWPVLKKAWKTVFPLSLINIYFMPAAIQIPVAAFLSYLVVLFGAPKTGEIPADQQRDKTSYLAATSNVTGKLIGNTAKGMYEGLEAMVSGARGLLYQAAPATQPT